MMITWRISWQVKKWGVDWNEREYNRLRWDMILKQKYSNQTEQRTYYRDQKNNPKLLRFEGSVNLSFLVSLFVLVSSL